MNHNDKKKLIRRLNIINGQLRGLEKMIKGNKYCIDVIHQSLAIKRALSSLEDLILESHLAGHVVEQMRSGKNKKAAKEILSIYKLSKRK